MPRGRSLRLWQDTPAQDTGTVSAWPGARAGATAPFTAGTAQGPSRDDGEGPSPLTMH